jgi:hypothetical protein
MPRLLASSRAAKGRLESLEPRLSAVTDKLAAFSRELSEIRQLFPDHPLLARERFFIVRNEYFNFEQQNHGFDFTEFERDAASQRKAALVSSRISQRMSGSDPGFGELAVMREEVEAVSRLFVNAAAKVRKVRLAGRALERQLLEISALIK